MEERITKGMILSAGLGTRLRPITYKIPKPLVPVLNIPNIIYGIALLKRTGINDIIINIHHLPDIIESYLGDGSRWDIRISFSREPVLLGTGGGVKKAERFFENKAFVLVNCDFVTNVNLKPVIKKHFQRRAAATMVLIEDPAVQSSYSAVGISESENLCSLPSHQTTEPVRKGIFTGIHILSPEIFRYLEEKPSGINQVLYPALMKECPERVQGAFVSDHYWYDTGDCHFLWATSMKLLDQLAAGDTELTLFMKQFGNYEEKRKGIWIAREESVPENCELIPPIVLGRSCKINDHCRIGPYAVLGDGSVVETTIPLTRCMSLSRTKVTDLKESQGALIFEGTVLSTKKSPASQS